MPVVDVPKDFPPASTVQRHFYELGRLQTDRDDPLPPRIGDAGTGRPRSQPGCRCCHRYARIDFRSRCAHGRPRTAAAPHHAGLHADFMSLALPYLREWRLCRPQTLRRTRPDRRTTIEIVKRSDAKSASRFCSSDGSSSEPSLGSAVAERRPRIGRNPSAHPRPGSTLPISTSQRGALQATASIAEVSSQALRKERPPIVSSRKE